MIPFPTHRPTQLTLTLPSYPVIPGSWRAQEAPTLLGDQAVGTQMRLRYRNVTDDVVLELLQVWRATGGGMAQLDPLPSEIAAGIQDSDLADRILAVEPLAWVMAGPPQQESVKAGRSNVTVELVAELRVKVALGGLCT